jgi:hypothetical protein
VNAFDDDDLVFVDTHRISLFLAVTGMKVKFWYLRDLAFEQFFEVLVEQFEIEGVD